jgi:hypothetical protein
MDERSILRPGQFATTINFCHQAPSRAAPASTRSSSQLAGGRCQHYLCRSAPERWLETIVSEDPTKLDAQLDVRHFYSQVPGLAAGDRGVLDLLGITRRGRLVVIVLKASEDIQMPIPAVNDWLRVRRHQREEDFQEYGYIEIDRWCGLWPPGYASIPRPTLF